MSLDQNLFTLFLVPNPSYPAGTVVDLTDNSGTIHYRKRRIIQEQQLYRIEVSDPLSEALLASATAPSATTKHKTLELYNPTNIVELKYTGTLTFRWSFKWETHEFEWKREECFIIRKPDPPVLVAVTKEPPGRIRTASIQILDYNLNRFDIDDRKGLEIVILTALLTFQDASDMYHEPDTTTPTTASTPSPVPATPAAVATPTPPSRPSPKKGIERIAELQLASGQVNEVTVFEEGAAKDYAKHCAHLLQEDAMLFISVRSSDPSQVPKVLQVVEETKRLRYKAGDQDLHQYVVYDTKEEVAPQKGPRIINLDDNHGKNKIREYTPPTSLTVHLSKIDMPELRPGGTSFDGRRTTSHHDQDSGKKKEKETSKRAKGKEKAKDKDKHKGRDQDGRTKRPSLPDGQGTSPPHPSVLRKYHSQYFQPTASGPSYASYRTQPAQHSSGTLRRQSIYGPLNTDYYGYEGMASVTSPTSTGSLNSGLLGRLLGR